MSVVEAIVLGTVQGLTEFVPISSSGHLVLVPDALGWEQPGLAFDVLLHAASLVALLAYFAGDLIDIAVGLPHAGSNARRLVVLLAVGTIPAAVAGLAFGAFFEDQFDDVAAAAVQLVVTAAILVAGERALAARDRAAAAEGRRLGRVEDLSSAGAGAIGLAQAVSILPGISRSGSTIAAGLGLGLARDAAARFSFLLSIPALAGASLVELPDVGGASLGLGAGVAGFVASLVTSYASIWGLIRYLKLNTLYPFAVYCAVAGSVSLLVFV